MANELQAIIPMSQAILGFIPVVRAYLRDFAELNRLLAGVETGDRFIGWSIMDAVSRFNGTPFFTTLSFEDLLQRQQHWLLLRMTTETILESVGLLQTRNHINYSNGGINVGVNDKTPMIQNWLQLFSARTDQMITRVKVALNIEPLLGGGVSGVHSELWFVNSTYLAY